MRALFLVHGNHLERQEWYEKFSLFDVFDMNAMKEQFSHPVTPVSCHHLDMKFPVTSAIKNAINAMIEPFVEAKMSLGSTVIIGSNKFNHALQTELIRYANNNFYKVYFVNTGEEEVSYKVRGDIERLETDSDVNNVIFAPVHDFSDKRVVVTSDIQSAGKRFERLVHDYNDGNTEFIIAGDAFDRGNEPVLTFRIMSALSYNAHRVWGNHEENIIKILNNPQGNSKKSTRETLREWSEGGVSEKLVRKMLWSYVPMMDFIHGGKRYFVSHGGVEVSKLFFGYGAVEKVNLARTADVEFIQGARGQMFVEKNIGDYSENIDELLSHDMKKQSIYDSQVHGHRNSAHNDCNAFEGVFNTESRAEFDDGFLTAVILENGEQKIVRID